MPFVKRNKRLEISSPTNFEHRVHSGFDHSNGVFVGLPSQWNSIINETEQQQQKLMNIKNSVSNENFNQINENNLVLNNVANSANNHLQRGFNRPKPIIDPSRITPTELTCFKVTKNFQDY